MERKEKLFLLALTLPLLLFSGGYAYAATVMSPVVVTSNAGFFFHNHYAYETATCPAGEFATGGGGPTLLDNDPTHIYQQIRHYPSKGGADVVTGDTPDGYTTEWFNSFVADGSGYVGNGPNGAPMITYAICIPPITVAGLSVPEFGSLYVAIAIAALVYLMVSRRYAKRPSPASIGPSGV